MSSNIIWYALKIWQALDLPGFTRQGRLPKNKGKRPFDMTTPHVPPPQFKIDFQPTADPAAVVEAPHARFTVLSSRLLRLEYSPGGKFEDRPSQVFWYRQQPAPPFEVASGDRSGGALEIRTGHLRLHYAPEGGPFNRKTLSIEVLATGRTWHYGDRDHENLRGTTRTLDGAGGAIPLEPGLASRAGWALVDDSKSLVFTPQGWLEPRQNPGALDLYFFGFGHDYPAAVRQFTQVAGAIPLLPRWALGSWWSRFWEYTQEEYLGVMEEFRQHGVPLSVGIIDMDWHITKTGNQSSGWTGYTWNRQLFPDPETFLRRLHALGLKTALNVHPAEGIHPHEEQYPEMARRMGVDPQSAEPVPFDIADPKFTQAYFEVLHHPQEEKGVDFWWIDWQQGKHASLPGLDPLYWLNHLHFYDLGRAYEQREGRRRPFIFSRWPGYGGHRYPIGFSGDTLVTWDALAFQPYFTATAANVAYTWWSHDIGGHMRGSRDPELYARWVQYGAFSPILRLHSTKNRFHERRPWGYSAEIERAASDALRLRQALGPYLYSMAWRTHTEARPLCQPMYYLYPEAEEAYHCPGQYLFGSELLAAPFVTRREADTHLARQSVWLPEGDWFNFFSGGRLRGGRWVTFYGGLDDIPVLARAGAIVPLEPLEPLPGAAPLLELHLFPAADNAFELYEDDGESQAYLQGQYCLTAFSLAWRGDHLELAIEPARGEASFSPPRRAYRLVFHGLRRPDSIRAQVDGAPLESLSQTYDEHIERLALEGVELAPTSRLVVELGVEEGTLLSDRDRRAEAVERLLNIFDLDADTARDIFNALPDLLAGRVPVHRFANRLKGAQLEALEEALKI